MVEWFGKSEICMNFLRNYPNELLSEIIPNVFEIGILTLKNSFNKFYFPWDEIRDILYDLRKNKYNDNLNFQSIKKIREFKEFFDYEKYNEEREREIFSGKKIFKKPKNIYPNWWWKQNNETNQNQKNYHNKNKSNQYYETDYRNRSHSHHNKTRKMKMNKLTKRDFTNTLQNNQSKHHQHHHHHHYNSNNNLNEPNEKYINTSPTNTKNNLDNNINKRKVNYKISYDKDLKVEKIEKKGELNNQYSYYKGNINKDLPENNNMYNPNNKNENTQ